MRPQGRIVLRSRLEPQEVANRLREVVYTSGTRKRKSKKYLGTVSPHEIQLSPQGGPVSPLFIMTITRSTDGGTVIRAERTLARRSRYYLTGVIGGTILAIASLVWWETPISTILIVAAIALPATFGLDYLMFHHQCRRTKGQLLTLLEATEHVEEAALH